MKVVTQEQLDCLIAKHNKWHADEKGGERLVAYDLDFSNLDFRLADLGGSWLINCNFTRADFRGASLRWTVLDGSNFHKANLSWADFENANMNGTNFTYVRLEGTIGLYARNEIE